jgi:ubiquinone/menaquinone biosynthesis C-methylase UbiE
MAKTGSKSFARFWDWQIEHESARVTRMRRETVGGARGRVLEIGCGAGANFQHNGPDATSVLATDPSEYMLERARKRVERAAVPVELRQASALELPFEDASFDTVVSTANFCTIPEPARALAEIRRVLRPGGEYRFFDHVRSGGRAAAFFQDAITPLWRIIGAGCHPNRDIERLVREAGFSSVEATGSNLYPPIPPLSFVSPHVHGVATR